MPTLEELWTALVMGVAIFSLAADRIFGSFEDMIDEIILHIGATKTGTTALQSYWASQRQSLQEQGVTYPRLFPPNEPFDESAGNAFPIARLATHNDSPQPMLDRLATELEKTTTPRVLLSSEALGGLARGHQASPHLQPLAATLLASAKKVRIIFAYRGLVDHAWSQYAEYCRRRGEKRRFGDFIQQFNSPLLTIARHYRAVFGAEQVTFVDYDHAKTRLIPFFSDVLDLPSMDMDSDIKNGTINPSMNAVETEMARHLNTLGIPLPVLRSVLVQFTQDPARPIPPGPRHGVTVEDIEIARQRWQAPLETLNAEISGSGAKFHLLGPAFTPAPSRVILSDEIIYALALAAKACNIMS